MLKNLEKEKGKHIHAKSMEKSQRSDNSCDRESTCNLNSTAFSCDLEVTLRSLTFRLRDIP